MSTHTETKETTTAPAPTPATSEHTSSVKKKKTKSVSRSRRAGLQFPVGRISRLLHRKRCAARIGGGAPVYLTAVLEYLCAEMLELAGDVAKKNKRTRIAPRHLQLVVRQDEELNKLFDGVTIASGGVIPNIHSVLLPKRKAVQAVKTPNVKKTKKKTPKKKTPKTKEKKNEL